MCISQAVVTSVGGNHMTKPKLLILTGTLSLVFPPITPISETLNYVFSIYILHVYINLCVYILYHSGRTIITSK